jgi:DNA invertase Pin-like site-specific DNA recombinase
MSKPTSIPAYPIRAYSYMRFSTAQQAEGGSLKRQAKLRDDYCKRKNLVLDDTLNLSDLGVSAFRGDNVRDGALAGFLEACRMGRVPRGSYLIIESLDRLSRDQIRPALQLFLALQDFGIVIVTLQPEREYHPDGADALSLIEPLIVFARSHEESLIKSHRKKVAWSDARDLARQTGKPIMKTCPCWLEVTPDGFKVKEEAASTVRRIFAMACDGFGVDRITRTLNRDGTPPIGNLPKWNKAFVYARVLTSPAAAGTYQPHRQDGKRVVPDGAPIYGFYPSVVSQEEWDSAQAAIQSRNGGQAAGRKGKEDTNLFTGLLIDAVSGRRLQIVNALGRKGPDEPKKYRYLTASHATGEPCGLRIDYGVFEEAVLRLFSELKPADLVPSEKPTNGRQAEIARLSGLLLDIDNRLARAKQRAVTSEDFDSFLDLIQELQAARKQTLEKRAELERAEDGRAPADLGEAKTLISLLKAASDAERPELRRRLKQRIRHLITSASILIVRRGKICLCVAQFHFRGNGKRRDYLIMHKPGTRYGDGFWLARSLPPGIAPVDFDLRKKACVGSMTKKLAEIDLDWLKAKMS